MRNEPRYHRPLQPENPRSWGRRRSVSRPFARAIGSGLPRRVISSAPPVPRATRSATPPFSEATSLLWGGTRRHSVEPERRSSGAPVRSPMRTDVAVRQASLTGGGAGGPPPGTPAVVRGGVRPCLMPAGAGWAPPGAACVPSAGPPRRPPAAPPPPTPAPDRAPTQRPTPRLGALQKAVPERGAEFLAPRALRGPPREVGVGEKFPHHALVGAAACRECAPFVMPRPVGPECGDHAVQEHVPRPAIERHDLAELRLRGNSREIRDAAQVQEHAVLGAGADLVVVAAGHQGRALS